MLEATLIICDSTVLVIDESTIPYCRAKFKELNIVVPSHAMFKVAPSRYIAPPLCAVLRVKFTRSEISISVPTA